MCWRWSVKWSAETERRWQKLAEEVMSGMKEWRQQHPKATLKQIEAALDEGLAKMRARMIQDLALASAAREVSTAEEGERPRCPKCGQAMESHGQETRTLITNYNEPVSLTRSYAQCPVCQTRLFPPG